MVLVQKQNGRVSRMAKKIDLGDLCVHCRNSTALGHGRFVNRISAEHQDGADTPLYIGWLCAECAFVEVEDREFLDD